MASSNNAINNTVGASISGVTNTLTTTNLSNTASSSAQNLITVGGSSAGDPELLYTVSGVTNWISGIDNSDSDKYKICRSTALGTNDFFVMTTSGERTLPSQPGFRAYLASTATNATGDGTLYTVVFGTEVFDTNSDYDTGTGLFTAPVDGVYEFCTALFFQGNTASMTSSELLFYKNGSEDSGVNMGSGIASKNGAVIAFTRMSLTASDTVGVRARVSGGTKVSTILGSQFDSFFTGFLDG